jgi:hypothetical protein
MQLLHDYQALVDIIGKSTQILMQAAKKDNQLITTIVSTTSPKQYVRQVLPIRCYTVAGHTAG